MNLEVPCFLPEKHLKTYAENFVPDWELILSL